MKTKSNWQKPIAIKLYKSIKITMSQKGITQVMLASKMGIEKGNMWKILNSLKRGKLPSFNVIKELEKILLSMLHMEEEWMEKLICKDKQK